MPQEIIDMVIDCLVDSIPASRFSSDTRTLATCALVCRSWVPRSRYHLFYYVTLDKSVAAFGELLRSDKCTFLPYVHDISAFRTFMDPNDHHFDKIGKDLRRLPNVTSLMLDGMHHACAPWADFMCGFKNVTDLSLHFHLTGNSNCVFGMIHMLPSLRRLRIIPISPVIFWKGRPPPPSIDIPPPYLMPPPHLHNIHVGQESVRHLLAWLKWFNRIAQIDTLDISPFPTGDTGEMKDLLSRMSGTLQHLKLNSEVKLSDAVYEHASLVDVVDISLYKHLKTLTLPSMNSDAQDAAAYKRFLKFILRISAPALESVALPLPGGGYKVMDWATVDSFFASPDFPRLHTVRISAEKRFHAYFAEHLPLLHELGKLKVDDRVDSE